MNRRLVVVGIAVAAVLATAVAGVFYQRLAGNRAELSGAAAQAVLVRPHSPVLGEAAAPVTIVEFFDPACEACRVFHPIIKRSLRQYAGEVRVVLRYAAFHNVSQEAIRMLEAARRQGLFEEILDALFRDQSRWASHSAPDPEAAWQLARAAGLDIERARADMNLPEITERINVDTNDIRALNVRQTPTIYIAGEQLRSYDFKVYYEQLLEAIDAAKARAAQ